MQYGVVAPIASLNLDLLLGKNGLNGVGRSEGVRNSLCLYDAPFFLLHDHILTAKSFVVRIIYLFMTI